MSVASAAGLVALETAALAPASKISSSRADSGDSVSTITAMLSRSALICRMSSTARSDSSISSISTRSGVGLDDRLDRRGSGIEVAEQVELTALAQGDRDRFDDQRVLSDDDESLHRTSVPNRCRFNKAPELLGRSLCPPQ